MIDYITHYYKKGATAFQSISGLPDSEALKIMENLSDDSPLFERFKTPLQYLQSRKETEEWLKSEFAAKGGRPKDEYPIYAVLGTSGWIEGHATNFDLDSISIPFSIFAEQDISFTFPDSMVSYSFGKDNAAKTDQSEYYGKIFTLSEIKALVERNGLPEKQWKPSLPENIGPYIEAQIWNHRLLHSIPHQPL